ncbi:MAG: M10 family metallopeptidase C-terminal domain-containing protein, partial [Mycobacterium sp.]
QDLSFRNAEEGFAPGWSLHADQIHLPWLETAPNGEQVDGFARREADVLRLPLFAGPDGNSARPIPTGITQPYSVDKAALPVLGTPGDDVLVGTSGDDRLEALEGNDSLIGAGGADLLVGSDGADRFVLESISDSTFTAPDEIIGFGAGDRLDLTALNLSPTSIQIQQRGASAWFVRADGTNLEVRIRTDELTVDQIILD